jgi:HSP20 family protein
MNIVRWDPLRELEEVSERLNRAFGRPLGRKSGEDALVVAEWAPVVDIQETDKEFLIKAELPEVRKEDVKVEIAQGVLCIEGERKQEKEEKGMKFHRIERSYGRFLRTFALPADVDQKKIEAEFKDGVLNVHLAKTELAKPKAIEVKVA